MFDKYLFLENLVENKVLTVSEFLDKINVNLTSKRYFVQGEVGEKINKYDRYYFFNLIDKNDKSVLSCFVWKEVINFLGLGLEPGMEIKVFGYPEIRKERGEFKFQVEKIELIGEGLLKKQFEILEKKLEAEGYFDESIKKKIPDFCQNIGLITSKTGRGALKDFITHLGNFGFNVFLYDVKVEGNFALEEIILAINYFNHNMPFLDVLVIIRGGGDWESLKPFNSEEIVKAIVSSRIPIIVGVGHEDDRTLADRAADLRASTPTHAAKILTENWKRVAERLPQFEKNLNSHFRLILRNNRENLLNRESIIKEILKRNINQYKADLDNIVYLIRKNFQEKFQNFYYLLNDVYKLPKRFNSLIKNHLSKINDLTKLLEKNKIQYLKFVRNSLSQIEDKINLSSPLLKLKQGYSITKNREGKIIKSFNDIKEDELIETIILEGRILSKVKSKKKNGKRGI